jgi:hypothetical protein
VIENTVSWLYTAGEGYPYGIWAKDGTKDWIVRWRRDGSTIKIACLAADGFTATTEVAIDYYYRGINIRVIGTELKVYCDITLLMTMVLNKATTAKTLSFGMLPPISGTHWGTIGVAQIKYYTGGNTRPTY